jgi:precorrin-6A synthase
VRKIHVIGIGAGDPEQLTLQAVRALRSTDVFFVLDKGEVKSDLTQLRRDMLDAHIPEGSYRVVEARDPERDRRAGGDAYSPAVGDWRSARADIYERLITEELGDQESGAFLVWGDPALYDSTLGILGRSWSAARSPSSTTSCRASAVCRRWWHGTAPG